MWILLFVAGIRHCIHYLDDYFSAAATEDQCKQDMQTMSSTFTELGVLLAPEKITGPARKITYLGIQIDSLPTEKYNKLMAQLRSWGKRGKCTKRELLSLIGTLSFAAKVVKPGRMFLRRLINLSTTVSKLDHHVTLNAEAQADIEWWTEFLPLWNGVKLIQHRVVTSHALEFYTDTSDKGFGAVYGRRWLFAPWENAVIAQANINV